MSDTKAAKPEEKLTKKQLKADHPTWCPACGDFAVLASFFNSIQALGLSQTDFVCVAGIGCSSRFPYFVNSHGIHFIHGRAVPLATGISLSRPDQHVFVFEPGRWQQPHRFGRICLEFVRHPVWRPVIGQRRRSRLELRFGDAAAHGDAGRKTGYPCAVSLDTGY